MSDESDRTMMRRVPAQDDAGAEPLLHMLVVEAPGEAPRRVALGAAPLRVGRVPDNDIVLPSSEISRAHCTFALRGDEAMVTDLGSTNGCYLNGVRIHGSEALRSGARLRLGPYAITHLHGPRTQLERGDALERDLAKAGRYVLALLPPPITDGPVRVDWRFLPCIGVGGDGFGYRALPDGRFIVWLMDVAGHGAGASMLAVSVMNTLREGSPAGADPGNPAAVLAGLNGGFQMDRHGGLYFTIWYAVYDPGTRMLRYASAGQHAAFLGLPGTEPIPLSTRNPGIGLAAPERVFGEATALVPEGARLTLFSDGAFEVQARDGTQLTLRDFIPHLAAPPEPGMSEPERLLAAIRDSSRPGPMEDDVAILSLDFP
ncbi:PP2C family protein-serine/threonine phosphatase [Plastoroseomonas arctica]|uniref:SpoIIE family protein phosphatase n=1 Tax=Plastoroseomonas arctica TaxID=1509237 RepID=A0AAF1JW56_9PROT|nr:SpoIIE family protein phosphatase [Plastoroseomonas arctica]MBR0654832.1 SpoIIE family protein phosphatase [Plastoroseomonas arctica]